MTHRYVIVIDTQMNLKSVVVCLHDYIHSTDDRGSILSGYVTAFSNA